MFTKFPYPPTKIGALIIIALSSCFFTPGKAQTSTLVGLWRMNEGSGTTLVDNSALGNNAILQNVSNVTWITGKDGLALSLPGTTNRFAIAPNNASLNITDKITIAGWIKPIALSTSTVLSKTGADGYELGTSTNGKIEFKFNADTYGSTYRVYSNISYPTDGATWMHVAAIYDGASSKIYINGILDKTVTFTTPVPIKTNTSGLYIGAKAGSSRWKGALDDIRLYHGALTASEVSALPGITIVPPAAPILNVPANASVNIPYNQTLSWNPVSGATKYRAEVSQDVNFTTTFLAQDDITGTSVALSGLLPNTVYYWRVRASNSVTDGNWSAVWSFTTAPLPPPGSPVLVGYWKMNEGSGATLIDNSVFGNNAALQNVKDLTWVAGKDGLALNLPGTTNRFAIAPNQASLNITDKLTIACWIKPIGLNTATILSKSGTDGYELATNTNGKIEFRFNADTYGSTYRIYSNTSYPTDGTTWMHVAATYDGASSKIYINGILDKTVTFSNPVAIKTNTSGLYIGSLLASRRWKGSLDELRLYQGALTATGIGQLPGIILPPQEAPVLTAPANASIDIPSNQVLSWNAVTGATKYRAEVSTNVNFTTTFFAQDDIAGTSVAMSNLLPNTVYYWRVRGANAAGNGNWSAVWNFTTLPLPPAAPNLLTPADAAIDIPYNQILSWGAVTGAAKYRAEVSSDINFTTTFLAQDNITGTSVQLSGLLPATVYYWRVRGTNSGGDGNWSAVRSFTTLPPPPAAPDLIAPADASVDVPNNQTLSWNAAAGATKYRAEASADASFTTTFLAQDDIATTSLALSNLLPNTLYYWRIRSGNSGGNSDWSAVWNFTTLPLPLGVPDLITPANASVDIPYDQTLSWSSVVGATKYGAEVSSDADFTTTFLAQDDIVATSVALSNLVPNTTYYWRVRAFDSDETGNWSAVWSFTTSPLPPSVPNLVAPANASVNIPFNQTLSWGAATNATKYRTEVSTDASFTTTFLAQDDIVSTSVALSNLLPNTVYYWRVRAANGGGNSDWSETWSFTTLPPSPAAPVLTAPANAAVNIPFNQTLSWGAVSGATTYRAEVSSDINFTTTFLAQDNIAGTSVAVSNLLPSTVYYWRVRAANAGGNGDWSAVWSFTTAAPLTLIHYWNFNGATVAAMITPTLTLNSGSLTETLIAGSTSEVGTANNFTGVNARNGDVAGNHYRLNNAIGSVLTFSVPTTSYKDIIIKYETRRSTTGSEIQKVSYALDGSTYVLYQTLNINNVTPALITFDLSGITGVNNNPSFKLKIEFQQGTGSLAGNNRFDNVTVEGNSMGVIVPLPDQVQTTTPADNEQNVILHPVLNWLAASNSVSYELEVATDNLFTNVVAQKTVSGSLSYKLESALAVATNYFWRVRGVNTADNGAWSDVKTFTTALELTVYKVAINEAMSSNTTVITDDDGTYQDWLELVNYGTTPVNLQGFGLSDAATTPFKWVLPAKTLNPGEFLIIWASNKNRVNPGLPLHTNFAISSGGEELVLTSPDGEWTNYMPAVAIPANSSRGRQPDGTGDFFFFSTSTPGATNVGGIGEILTRAAFSQAPGIYASGLSLSITHPDPAVTIRYTLDGSEPTESSPIYQQPLTIVDRSGEPNDLSLIPTNNIVGTSRAWVPPGGVVRKGTVIRAKSFKLNAVPSETITGTYLVLPGRQYTVPVISVVVPKDSFFSFQRGIYVPGVDYVSGDDETGNYYQQGDSSERAGSIEFYSSDLSFQQNIGYRINGNFSRRFPQKSLRLVAKSIYGKSSLDYPVFPNYTYTSFKRLVLSNSGNDWGHTMFKDAVASMLVSHIMPTEAYRPSVVFLNGEYWGIHDIREHADKFYLAQKFGVDEDNIDRLVDQYEVEDGDNLDYKEMLNYIQNTDLTNEANFEGVRRRMDVDNFIDYMSAEVYYANTDWPNNNIEYWRAKVANNRNPGAPIGQDGRWRWIFHDIDAGFGNAPFNAVEWVTTPVSLTNGKEWPNVLLRKLLTNQEFKFSFINRIADQINSAFITSRMHQKIDSVKLLIASEISEHIQRWTRPASVSGWNKYIDSMKLFATERPAYLRQHLKNAFALGNELTISLDVSNQAHGSIQLNSLTINSNSVGANPQPPYPWQGIYFGNVPVKLKAIPNSGFAFDYWLIDGQVFSGEERTLTPGTNSSVKAFFVQTTGVKPVLELPANAATGVAVPTANFSWQPVAQANSYRLQVSSVADFSTRLFDQSALSNTNTNVSGLLYSTLYYWRVMANGVNGSSDWSDVRSFTTISYPAVVNLSAPANSATNIAVNPVLSWDATANANNYSVQLSNTSNFSALIINLDNVPSISVKIGGLLRNTIYYWRVKANNINGSSAWSERSFTTATLVYTTDFVGHWKMNEDTGATLLDHSGYGNHASLQTLSDVYRVPGIEGTALSLQGSTNRFAIAPNSPSLNITNQITITAWIRPTELGTRTILSKAGTDGYELAINSNGKFEFRINPDTYGTTYRLYSTGSYPFDGVTWMHVAATFDGTSSKIYINGVLNASVTFANPTTIISNTSGLYIGSLLSSRRWKGLLDDIQLYKRALSASEIMQIVSPVAVTNGSPLYSIQLPVEQTGTLKVYPNPFSEKINVDFGAQAKGNINISIIDVIGRTYYKTQQRLETNQLSINLADSHLKPGLYFLVIKTPAVKEFIKLVKN